MDHEALSEVLAIGETVNVEFKRCGQQPERDVFESVCSFANTFGGSIFLGVEDDGTVSGINASNLLAIKRNLINVVHNPKLFDSPVAFEFEDLEWEGKSLIRIFYVRPSWIRHHAASSQYRGNGIGMPT